MLYVSGAGAHADDSGAIMKTNLAIICLAVLILAPQAVQAAEPSLPKTEIVTLGPVTLDRALRAGSTSTAEIEARVLFGWHINSNRPLNPDYIPTRLTLTPPPGVAVGAIEYPIAEEVALGFSGGEKLSVFTGTFTFKGSLTPQAGYKPGQAAPLMAKLEYQACNDSQCLRPTSVEAGADLSSAAVLRSEPIDTAAGAALGFDEAPAETFASRGYILGFLVVLLGGLALILTPCVYPLIGVTVAYFGNQGGGMRRVVSLATIYVLGIALMFSGVGVAVALSGGLFGAALQNPYVLVAIAALLVALAGSSFGWFTIQAPLWMLQRAGSARPGYLGALVMGLGMGVVAAPCIGPLVLGLLLLVERSQSPLFGFALFFTLAVGMGLPYLALAAAAGSIRKLPRSGQWLGWVEELFGFVLIGLALYFIDPVVPHRLVGRMLPFYAVAAGLFLGFVSRAGRTWPPFETFKRAVGVLSLAALVYLLVPKAVGRPQLLFEPYDPSLLASAKAAHKPVVIDFAADWCVPCREMERTTFVDPAVVKAATRFVRLRADLTRQDGQTQDLISKFEIQGVPTTVFLDSQGTLRKRVVGYLGPREYLERLRQVD